MSIETRQVLVKLTEAEYAWLEAYARLHELSIPATIRVAVRSHNMLHLTSGALDAVAELQPRWPSMAESESV